MRVSTNCPPSVRMLETEIIPDFKVGILIKVGLIVAIKEHKLFYFSSYDEEMANHLYWTNILQDHPAVYYLYGMQK